MMDTARLDVRELDLKTRYTRVTDALLSDITDTFPGLTSLTLSRSSVRITDAGVAHLARLTGLTSLDLSYCNHITDAGVEHVQDLTPRCEVYR